MDLFTVLMVKRIEKTWDGSDTADHQSLALLRLHLLPSTLLRRGVTIVIINA